MKLIKREMIMDTETFVPELHVTVSLPIETIVDEAALNKSDKLAFDSLALRLGYELLEMTM